MTKIQKQIRVSFFLLAGSVIGNFLAAQDIFRLQIEPADSVSAAVIAAAGLQTEFRSRENCTAYIYKLPVLLQSRGFINASVDSFSYDSLSARVLLYTGKVYFWQRLGTDKVDPQLLDAAGWIRSDYNGKWLDPQKYRALQERILEYLENNGYPFAKIYFDNLQLKHDSISGELMIDKGPLYKIDSIRLYGDARISNNFLQRYLDIKNGSHFSKQKLENISKRILELNYVTEESPYDLSLLGTGSVLNLHLKQKKSSQINFLIGFLPNSSQTSSKKLLVTGEANINLHNALGVGETFGLNWQQIQVKSPRLNILYRHPYIFNSPLGLDLSFDMFRKDSSFLNVNMQLGGRYDITNLRSAKIFFQRFQTIISQGGINTYAVIQSKRLPDIADVSSSNIGVAYDINTTDYRNNPRKGWVMNITGTVGTKNVKKNNEILELSDPADPSFDFGKLYDTVRLKTYQLRVTGVIARYFRLKGQGVFKTSVTGGLFQSENIFRNELFQVGGFKLLRGFDEESQYLSQYVVATAEYRYLVGQNSYFYVFTDGGFGGNKSVKPAIQHSYLSTGLGMAFETKAGIFNLAWAVGKRDDIPFNLRQSKVHVGFLNYF
ncbi:MAG: BamA/TamA family outer membrane protein [Terrimonas sp.]|nr:BamA/TamA family outer membrane protein [Terrimonas sp.]